MNAHTPIPWKVGKWANGQTAVLSNTGGLVATMEAGSEIKRTPDAHFIVLACNEHDTLVEALKEAVRVVADAARRAGSFELAAVYNEIERRCNEALDKARG